MPMQPAIKQVYEKFLNTALDAEAAMIHLVPGTESYKANAKTAVYNRRVAQNIHREFYPVKWEEPVGLDHYQCPICGDKLEQGGTTCLSCGYTVER